ncbi:zinc-dependent microcin-processing U62/PmbA/TldD [Neokomagataea thailandica NBRC 106555]|uniref:Zinc-dependent microcin-processing U62/PmbA/TldD n=1 Tax=Neokomagataea thailandica NBRC 106555 TaxID=1223520 RepID=A0ABQ0QP34_9PROT|nr:TldD/PmbA family protein [Neokomagataea thailandica]GBR52023.1 zinc-dependent microcin-processing U62/PmbA/TldD [Neokomagataea thailandica NBRC 106555]
MIDTTPVEALLDAAKRHGADAADALLIRDESTSALVRCGAPEGIERSESVRLGLRVFKGQRSASVSTTLLDADAFEQLAEQACAMAQFVPEDRFGGLAENCLKGRYDATGLDLDDPTTLSMDALLERAKETESIALSHNGITNSSGASAGQGRSTIVLGTSAGFTGAYQRSSHSLSTSVLAGSGASMQRDYAFHSATHFNDLESPQLIGNRAAEQALARLNPTRPRTGTYDVIYHPRVAASLIGHLVSGINGAAIARGTSFLKDALYQRILPHGMDVKDDPFLLRGRASRPFDGEACLPQALNLVEDGTLQHWLLDSRSARQLNLTSNARASRGTSGPPSPSTTNCYLTAGSLSPEALRADIREGFLITELMGSSINMLTGDYSRGASGFMIRNGEIAEPVAEVTIAGNLKSMFAALVAANDLEFRSGINAPSIRINNMSLAGA